MIFIAKMQDGSAVVRPIYSMSVGPWTPEKQYTVYYDIQETDEVLSSLSGIVEFGVTSDDGTALFSGSKVITNDAGAMN